MEAQSGGLRPPCLFEACVHCWEWAAYLVWAPALDLLMHFIFLGTSTNYFNLVSDLPPTTMFKSYLAPMALTHASSRPSTNSLWPAWTPASASNVPPVLPHLVTVLDMQGYWFKAQPARLILSPGCGTCFQNMGHERTVRWVERTVALRIKKVEL